jgi:hypothetical protein
MDPRLQALIDRQDILDVLFQYAHACDRGDEPRIVEVYHPDAKDNHGHYQGTGHDFARVVCEGNKERDTMSHLLGQSQITIDGDRAGAETYYNATLARREGDVKYVDMMGGRYIDKLERRDGQWRISDRVCTCEWSMTMRVENEWHADGTFVCGTYDRNDLSYPVLGLAEREPAHGVS